MKPLPCHGAEERWSRRERALSPLQARGRCGVAGAPTSTAPAPHPEPAGAGQSCHPVGLAGCRCHAGPTALGELVAGHRLPGGCHGQLPATVLPRQEQRLLDPRRPPGCLLVRLVLPEDGGLLSGLPGRVPLCGSGLCCGALGAMEWVQLPVRGWQQGSQPPGHCAPPARRGSLSGPQATPRLTGAAPDLRHGQRGSQDIPQPLQPGLQRSLSKSWAATAGGAL